jgi:excisionase family DNA binding protein
MAGGKLLTLEQTLRYLGVSKSTLYRLHRRGQLRRRTNGRIVRWSKKDCDTWVRNHMQEAR